MAEISTAFNEAFRDFAIDGQPASGKYKPAKALIRNIGPLIEGELADLGTIAAAGINWLANATGTIRVRATANVAIASGLVNGTVLNGITLATGNHVFLPYQTAPAENGLYTVPASGAAARAAFANSAAELERIGFLIQSGTLGTGEQWTLPMAAADIVLGTTALNFAMVGIESVDERIAPMKVVTDDYVAARGRVDAVAFTGLAWAAKAIGPISALSVGTYAGQGNLYTKASVTNFNAVFVSMVSTALVEKIIVEVRDVSPTGTIVATGSRYVDGVEANRHGELAIPLSGLVDVSTLAGPNLFIGWYTVDKDGARTVSGTMVVVAPSTLQGYAGNTFRSTAASATWLAGDNFANLIGLVMLTGATVTTVREFAVRPRLIRQEQELMVLPTIIPAVVGRPSDIYFDGLTPLPKDTVKWRVACTDSTVTPMAERSRHVAAATGDVAIAYEAIDPFTGASLDIASATVRRVAANAGNGKSISWMAIGDSITYQDSTVAGHNGPGYVETVKTLSTAAVGAGTGPNVTCIGTIGPAGSKHEGYSGKSAPFFYSDPTSPFVFGGAFDFAQYMSTNGFAGVNYVSFLLGVNDGFNAVNDGDSTYYGTNSAAVIEAMIAGIHAYNAAIKVVVCAPTPPGSSQDPFGSAYRAGTGRWASHWGHKRNVVTFARVLRDHFESRSAESIYFAMPGLGLDTDHSYSRSINVIHDDITFTVAATYAGLVADLTPADGALYYATDIAKFFRKIGATTKGTWRLALEEDGVISRMSDGVHPNPTGKAQLGRKFWDWFKMMEV